MWSRLVHVRALSLTPDRTQKLKEAQTEAEKDIAELKAKKEKERRREKERVQREEEFKVKYSRAFPSWVFYFDLDSGNPETASIRVHLEKRVGFMGAVSCVGFHFERSSELCRVFAWLVVAWVHAYRGSTTSFRKTSRILSPCTTLMTRRTRRKRP